MFRRSGGFIYVREVETTRDGIRSRTVEAVSCYCAGFRRGGGGRRRLLSVSYTHLIIANQLEMLEKLKGENRKSREVVTLPGMAQFRTTRCIDGEYTLKESDAYRHFDDSVGAICDFDRRDYLFEIPFGTIVKKGFHNLLTAGRSAAGEGYAWDVLRVIPPRCV